MKRRDDEITKHLVCLQKVDCLEGDYYAQTKRDLMTLSILEEDLRKSKGAFKNIVVKQVQEAASNYLISKTAIHSKVTESLYSSCDGADYFRDPQFSPDLANLLFQFRTRGHLVKNNFRNNYVNTNILCPLCESTDDTQEHLFEYEKLRDVPSTYCEYKDIFSGDRDILLNVAKNLKKIVELRKNLLNPDE